jgi:methionine-rich copper-binding protein CopC
MTVLSARRRVRPARRTFQVESLEARCQPSVATAVVDLEPNDSADRAQDLGAIAANISVAVPGTLGPADVDWFAFTLDEPAAVSVTSRAMATVLGLYQSVPFDYLDRFAQSGMRLLTHSESAAASVEHTLARPLAAGTYHLAVSGGGNRYFHPFLAGSGLDGAVGAYRVEIAAQPLGASATAPVLLATDPAQNAVLDSTPFVIRLAFSAALNPESTDTVQLSFHPDGLFAGGAAEDVALEQVNFSSTANELQLVPAQPLGPGQYRVLAAGAVFEFQVAGNEGNLDAGAPANDVAAGAHELGDIAGRGIVQARGAIGDDVHMPLAFDASDVDLYHLAVSGSGRYMFAAEVFGRRVGSPLNPAASLFRLEPSTGLLELSAANDDTRNETTSSDGMSLPLFGDTALFAGLTAGDYYVAVSSRRNVPDAARGRLPGQDGIFDPNVSRSGSAGSSTGPYVLNLLLQPDSVAPHVVSIAPSPGAVVGGPPTELVVQFSEGVDLRSLALRAFQQADQGGEPAVAIVGSDGRTFVPRLARYDDAANRATFQMLDRLPAGSYTVRLSSAAGLTDFAGNALAGGEFSSAFTVLPAAPGDVLFPHELQAGITLERNVASGIDSFTVDLLQDQSYFFTLSGGSDLQLTLAGDGGSVEIAPQGEGAYLALLRAGVYVVEVSGPAGPYQLHITLGGNNENPPPLTVGPAPALRFRLAPALASAPPPPSPSGGTVQATQATAAPGGSVRPLSTDSALTGGPSGQGTASAAVAAGEAPALFQALAAGPVGGVTRAGATAVMARADRIVIQAPVIQAAEPTLALAGAAAPQSSAPGSRDIVPAYAVRAPLLGRLALPVALRLEPGLLGALDNVFGFLGWFDDQTAEEEEPSPDAPPDEADDPSPDDAADAPPMCSLAHLSLLVGLAGGSGAARPHPGTRKGKQSA